MPTTVIVFAAADEANADLDDSKSAVVIAADAGAEAALASGLNVDLAVGDFDSLSPKTLARLKAAGTRIDRHPAAKDATDLELALDAAVALDPERVLVVAGRGGRLDHLLGSLLLLRSHKYAHIELDASLDTATVHVV